MNKPLKTTSHRDLHKKLFSRLFSGHSNPLNFFASFLTLLVFALAGCSDYKNNNQSANSANSPFALLNASKAKVTSPEAVYAQYLTAQVLPLSNQLIKDSNALTQSINRECAQWTDQSLETLKSNFKKSYLSFRKYTAVGDDKFSFEKDEYYDQPQFSACRADEQSFESLFTDSFTGGALKNIEYFLYSDLKKNSCDLDEHPELAEKYQSADLNQRRCFALKKLALHLDHETDELKEKMELSPAALDEHFLKALTVKNQILNPVVNSLFIIETLKDESVGTPLGLSKECLRPTRRCPDAVEDKLTDLSYEHFESVLRSAQNIFLNSGSDEKLSLYELLETRGFEATSDEFKEIMGRAIKTLITLKSGPSFLRTVEELDTKKCNQTTTTDRVVTVCAFYQDLKELSLLIRNKIVVQMSASIPVQHQGDAD